MKIYSLLVFLFVAILSLSSAGQQPSSERPPGLLGTDKGGAVEMSSNLDGWLYTSNPGKEIVLTWYYDSAGPFPDRGDQQVYPVAYHPTDAIGLGQRKVAVAGKVRAMTIVEVWEFEDPQIPFPSVDQATGEYRYAKISVDVISKHTVYVGSAVGMDVVRNLFPNPTPPVGVTYSVFAQFHDTGDLYRLDDTGVVQKVASPMDDTVLFEPEIAFHRTRRRSGNHPVHGHIFEIRGYPDGSGGGLGPIMFMDVDRNGSIDVIQKFTFSEWHSQGWDVPLESF